MSIQLVTNNSRIRVGSVDQINTLNSPKAFDLFDINILDLSYEELWKTKHVGNMTVSSINDFRSIRSMVASSNTASIVYVLPQNVLYKQGIYVSQGHEKYQMSIQLKDDLQKISEYILSEILPINLEGCLFYENSETTIDTVNYNSSFVFQRIPVEYTSLFNSNGNNKSTVISNERIIITTLDVFKDNSSFLMFLSGCGLIEGDKEPIPEWLKTHSILDDEEQKREIDECNEIITEATERIVVANSILKKNMEYKSILYENGDSLVKHVFWILEELLDYDLSDFIDEKKEDFLIQMPDITFIGEIKGVTSNVKSENISQVDVHYQGYMDKLREEGREENVKQLLIMNPLRKYPLESRESVHEIQIKLAKRNDCLIITTEVLLQLFEKFRNKEVTTETIKDKFINEIGILDLGVF